jgi:hypothetical protein
VHRCAWTIAQICPSALATYHLHGEWWKDHHQPKEAVDRMDWVDSASRASLSAPMRSGNT